MNQFRLLALTSAALVAAGALAIACSGGPGSESDEWTGTASSQLACQGAGIHPESCGIEPPPPPESFTPCPTGDSCSLTPSDVAAPLAGCVAPEWFSETGRSSAAYFVSTCSTGAALDAWISSETAAGWSAGLVASLPGLPAPGPGKTYLTFAPPTPAAPPSPCNSSGVCAQRSNIDVTVDLDPTLPCTDMLFLSYSDDAGVPMLYPGPADAGPESLELSPRPSRFSWVAYCVDTPAVDSLAAEYGSACASSSDGGVGGICLGAGESAAPLGMAEASYGYVYLYSNVERTSTQMIGGSCTRTCITY